MDRLESFDSSDLKEFIAPPKIKIVGVGGAGNNTLNRLYSRKIKGVETFALNTDAIHLNNCQAHSRTVLGAKITQGRGAGGDPHLGKRCAEDDQEPLRNLIDGADMVFVIAGMGGGTGTGAAPVIAQYARDTEALVVGVAVLPFKTEGIKRRNIALKGLLDLKNSCHCVIELDNEKLNDVTKGKYPMGKAFEVMDDLITETVQSLSEIVTQPSTINVDFADLRKIVETGGNAKVLYGESESSEPGNILDAGNALRGISFAELSEFNMKLNLIEQNYPSSSIPITKDIKIINISGASLNDFILNGEKENLRYIAINQDGATEIWYPFLSDIYYNEQQYGYLKKIVDTNELGFIKFKVKVFEINYDKFRNP